MLKRNVFASLAIAGALATAGLHGAHDHGIADEPVTLTNGTTIVVPCSADATSAALTVALASASTAEVDHLVALCDHRVTGEHCEEDQVCAAAEVNETGRFK